ncbi:MAG: IS4 family transposase, partial [Verrucomicrobiota bacterium]
QLLRCSSMQPIIRYFSRLRRIVRLEESTRQAFLYDPATTFVRKSPLTFARTIGLIFSLMRKSLAVELGHFFRWRSEQLVTKSAFCQRRQHIKPQVFKLLFEHSATLFYRCFKDYKRWKGKRLMAVDGSGQSLPRFHLLGRIFGYHQNQHNRRPSIRMLLTYDVLNNIINRVDLHDQATAEIVPAYLNVARLPKDAIYIYDRHYASFALAYLHLRYGSDFVIRMRTKSGAKIVENFMQSTEKQTIIEVALNTGRAFYKLRQLGLKPERNARCKIRLIRVVLDNGEVEILMTSLLNRNKYHYSQFKWLYAQRWGVETAFHTLKSYLQIALFSANTEPGISQDLWASFAFYNQQSALVAACEQAVQKATKHRLYEYSINRNVTAGLLHEMLHSIYLCGPNSWRAKTLVLLKLMPRYTEPYRPDRNQERKRKHIRANDRHIHEKNYRKAM